MARPIPQDGPTAMARLVQEVDRLKRHTHPGLVYDPVTIDGPRSDPAAILEQLLGALDAAGIIIDDTTD